MHTNIRYIVFIFLTLLVVNGTLKAQIRSETDSIVAPTLSANINEIEADTTATDSLNLICYFASMTVSPLYQRLTDTCEGQKSTFL